MQEEVRADFLAGTNGAVQVSAEVLDSLQVVQKLTTPTRVAGQSVPEMQVNVVSFYSLFELPFCLLNSVISNMGFHFT